MPKRKRARSSSSDSGSSYKQDTSDDEAHIQVTPQKRTRASASTRRKHEPVIDTPNAAVVTEQQQQRAPSKLLAALDNLAAAVITPPTPGQSAATSSQQSSPRKSQSISGSPRKAAKPPVKPESEWRASDIPEDVKITKGFAQKFFRLTAADINDSQLPCKRKNRTGARGYMLLYTMRDIERLAWKKYGSPEGFDHKLDHEKELWISRGKDPIAFPRVPRPFNHYARNKCIQCRNQFSMSSSLYYEKCDTCRGGGALPRTLVRTLSTAEYTQYEDDAGTIMGLDDEEIMRRAFLPEPRGCALCELMGICCDD